MATATGSAGYFSGYSSWVAFRAVIDYSISSSNDTSATVKIVVKCKMVDGKDGGYNFNANGTIGGTKSGDSTGSGYYSAGGTYTIISSYTKTITKTHSAQSISVSAKVWDTYMGGSSTVNASISVPAKTSHSVAYNANSGSGAPATQTKWYGETLALSSTKPTRTNYNFTGWNTKADGTGTNYASGANYTSDAGNITLYAKWTLAAASPVITKLVAYRSDSSGNRVDEATTDTTHIKVEYGWTVDSGASSRKIQISLGGTAQTAITLSANSGTGSVVYARSLGIADTLIVSATVTDSTHSLTATKSTSVSIIFKPFTMTNAGLSAAFFGIAKSTWNRILKVFGNIRIQEDSFAESTTPSSNVYGRGVYLTDANDADVGYVRAMKLTNGQQGTQIETRRIISGTNKYNTLNLLLDNSGNPVVNISAPARPLWFGQVATWTRFADFNSGTTTTISIPAAANEILVFARCTNTVAVDGVNVRRYSGTVLIPKGLIDTTSTEWMLGGGSVESTSSSSGTRYCAIRLSTTKALGVGAYCDGTNYQSSTHFWMYWR